MAQEGDTCVSQEEVTFSPTRTTYDSLCQLCRVFLDLTEIKVGYQRGNLKHRFGAGDRGCTLCKMASRRLNPRKHRFFPRQKDCLLYVKGLIKPTTLAELRFRRSDGVLGHDDLLVEYSSNRGFQMPSPIYGKIVGRGPSWGCLEKWLFQCRENHALCTRSNSLNGTSWLPTRLIDVGTSNDNRVTVIDTRTTQTSRADQRYITLSHRWGEGEMFKLTSNNINTCMGDGILLSSLRQTFIDAIQACRQLGVRFLWIDSLCIIQDSQSDWKHESATMDQVYSNSYLTLAAAIGSQSLFGPRDFSANLFQLFIEGGPSGNDILLHNKRLWQAQVEEASLQKRGWVVQERMLSPRVVHFGNSQLFWECEEVQACETFPKGVTPDLTQDLGKSLDLQNFVLRFQLRDLNSNLMTSLRNGSTLFLPYELWLKLVTRYSECDLTHVTDVLVAISGLAKKMSTVLKDSYIAGMWRSTLLDCLGWTVNTQSKGSVYSGVAPSWSWASIKTGINYSIYGTRRPLVKVKDVIITPADGHDEFGTLDSGTLVLQGNLLGGLRCYRRWFKSGPVYTECIRTEKGTLLRNFFLHPDRKPPLYINATKIYMLSVHERKVETRHGGRFNRNGLLLVRAADTTGEACVFRRFGWFSIAQEHEGSLFAEDNAGRALRSKHGISFAENIDVTII